MIDRVGGPGGVFHDRQRGRGERAKRPPLAGLVPVDALLRFHGGDRVGGTRVGRAPAHPGLEIGDDVRGQLLVRRHRNVLARVAQRLNEQARVGIARREGGTGETALLHARARVEQQAALQFFGRGAVTLVTILGQHRTDLALEKRDLLRSGGVGEGGAGRRGNITVAGPHLDAG